MGQDPDGCDFGGTMMKEPALVVLAAGLGSRYGGNKQVDGVGPNGEILMEYGIYDAIAAGFHKIVLLIKPDILDLVKHLCGDRLEKATAPDGKPVELVYAFQDYSSIPSFYNIPAGRTKPFGTVHALLCTKDVIDEPFVVINADDYYGPQAYRAAYQTLTRLAPQGEGMMVIYKLENTLSPRGTVTRGICRVEDGVLAGVTETYKIKRCGDGIIRDLICENGGVVLDPDAGVSMNFWGFTPSVFPDMERYFEGFLRGLVPTDIRGECLLPVMVDQFVSEGKLSVKVLETDAHWFGITYQSDKPQAREALAALHKAGLYPEKL